MFGSDQGVSGGVTEAGYQCYRPCITYKTLVMKATLSKYWNSIDLKYCIVEPRVCKIEDCQWYARHTNTNLTHW